MSENIYVVLKDVITFYWFNIVIKRDKIKKNEMGWACGAYG